MASWNFGVLQKCGMGVSPVSARNRKDGRDAHPTLSAPSEELEKLLRSSSTLKISERKM
jgi:hypothetical protein